jgi:mannosyl-oligosaccharide alpha-1,3-glucosidase
MVVISDPHFKKDDNYFVFKELRDKGFCVKTKDGNDFEGWCWPGASYYPDFLNPAVRDWYVIHLKERIQIKKMDLKNNVGIFF